MAITATLGNEDSSSELVALCKTFSNPASGAATGGIVYVVSSPLKGPVRLLFLYTSRVFWFEVQLRESTIIQNKIRDSLKFGV
jgi:hypothetical protein